MRTRMERQLSARLQALACTFFRMSSRAVLNTGLPRVLRKNKKPVCFCIETNRRPAPFSSVGSSCYLLFASQLPRAPGQETDSVPRRRRSAILLTWTMDASAFRAAFLPSHGEPHNGCLSATQPCGKALSDASGCLLRKPAHPHSSGRVGSFFFHRRLSFGNLRLQIFVD